MRYSNPILPGMNPDPSICRCGEDYYLVTSTFEYFPGIPVYHSRDLVNWRMVGHALTRRSQLPLDGVAPSGGIWAPTIRCHGGRFYVASVNMNGLGNFYVWTDDPAGEWSEPIKVAMGGIDPSLTFDGDKAYFTATHSQDGRHCIAQAEIDIETGALLSDVHFIWEGTGGGCTEAPHLYRIGDFYYLMCAEGGTFFTHRVTIARSESPWGPFEHCPHNPILTAMENQHATSGVFCAGHGDLIEDRNGNWWMVHLGTRIFRKYMSLLGRETFLLPVTWDGGWPVVNGGRCPSLDCEGPLPPLSPPGPSPVRDDFRRLDHSWRFLRNPNPDDYEHDAGRGIMRLRGSCYDVTDLASPALMVKRQTFSRGAVRTLADFAPAGENEEAGLIVLTSNQFYYKLCITLCCGRPTLVLHKQAEDFVQTVCRVPLEQRPVYLEIIADELFYTFSYGYEPDKMTEVGAASTRFLCCEVAALCFTGVQVGIYSTGKGKRCETPASFHFFEMAPL